MQFLTVSRRLAEKVPDGDLASLTEAEFECARALYSQNFIRQIWHRGDIPGACLIVEAESEQQVRETLRTLPFFKAGMLDVVIIPLKPYTGFAPMGRIGASTPATTATRGGTPQRCSSAAVSRWVLAGKRIDSFIHIFAAFHAGSS